jgi:hypothetical protein
MKKVILLFLTLLTLSTANAQSVGINTATPDASAALDVSSTTQGILVPRMTEAQRNLIATPATGLLVYQTDETAGFYFYNGTVWTSLNGGGSVVNSGTELILEATALIGQTIGVGVSITDGTGTIRFDNEVTGPVSGTWTSDSVFTVAETGLYMIQAHVLSTQTTSNFSSLAPYVEIKNSANGNRRRYFGLGITSIAFHTSTRGRGEVSAVVQLSVGDTVRIRVNSTSTSVTSPISTSGSTRLVILKL